MCQADIELHGTKRTTNLILPKTPNIISTIVLSYLGDDLLKLVRNHEFLLITVRGLLDSLTLKLKKGLLY